GEAGLSRVWVAGWYPGDAEGHRARLRDRRALLGGPADAGRTCGTRRRRPGIPVGGRCHCDDNLSDDGHSTFPEDTPMRGWAVAVTLLVGGIVVRAGAEQPMAPGCAKVAAAMDQAGGGLSADEIAKKTDTDVETVRGCMDAWNAAHKKDAAATPGSVGHKSAPPRCTKTVGGLDPHPGLTAPHLPTRTSTPR